MRTTKMAKLRSKSIETILTCEKADVLNDAIFVALDMFEVLEILLVRSENIYNGFDLFIKEAEKIRRADGEMMTPRVIYHLLA